MEGPRAGEAETWSTLHRRMDRLRCSENLRPEGIRRTDSVACQTCCSTAACAAWLERAGWRMADDRFVTPVRMRSALSGCGPEEEAADKAVLESRVGRSSSCTAVDRNLDSASTGGEPSGADWERNHPTLAFREAEEEDQRVADLTACDKPAVVADFGDSIRPEARYGWAEARRTRWSVEEPGVAYEPVRICFHYHPSTGDSAPL